MTIFTIAVCVILIITAVCLIVGAIDDEYEDGHDDEED